MGSGQAAGTGTGAEAEARKAAKSRNPKARAAPSPRPPPSLGTQRCPCSGWIWRSSVGTSRGPTHPRGAAGWGRGHSPRDRHLHWGGHGESPGWAKLWEQLRGPPCSGSSSQPPCPADGRAEGRPHAVALGDRAAPSSDLWHSWQRAPPPPRPCLALLCCVLKFERDAMFACCFRRLRRRQGWRLARPAAARARQLSTKLPLCLELAARRELGRAAPCPLRVSPRWATEKKDGGGGTASPPSQGSRYGAFCSRRNLAELGRAAGSGTGTGSASFGEGRTGGWGGAGAEH